ncbi:MAG: ATP-binding cassette domain-containing protein, partial [Geminicoccaceae bacterium]|nr:ATP-binding cassette domain-containing protein [Geminicoccaceae bacterium]
QLKVQQQADSMVRNADAVHAMGMTDALLRRLGTGRELGMARQLEAADRGALFVGLARFGRLLAQVALLATGAWLTLGDALTPGGIIAASMLFGRGMAPVEQATAAWRGTMSGWLAWRRIESALGGPARAPAPVRLPEAAGRFSMSAVTFVPAGVNRPVLEEVSLDLAPGEVCGVVGPSAAGKTTLCRLAVGTARPTTGEVRLDGMELAQWEPAHLGARIGYLPQDVELFEGTVAENIARMGEAESAEILEAAELAGVHEMVLRLPDGYATTLGPRGEPLSGGQRQRIGLARALFGKPALLVLDEPNASLDAEGEAALVEALRTLRDRGVTVLMVVHKASLLRGCDRIACLRDGRLCLFGERDTVLPKITGEPRAQPMVAGPGGPANEVRHPNSHAA